jgi:formate dehydrogenase subunit delta
MVHMANQIAQFFEPYPHEEAVAGVANHILKFWEKRMRLQLNEYIAQGGGNLEPLVLEAVQRPELVLTSAVLSSSVRPAKP